MYVSLTALISLIIVMICDIIYNVNLTNSSNNLYQNIDVFKITMLQVRELIYLRVMKLYGSVRDTPPTNTSTVKHSMAS